MNVLFVKDNCIGYICVAYRSPVQSNIEFENFPSDFSELLSKIVSFNSLFTIILGDFNLDFGEKKNKIKEEGGSNTYITFNSLYQNSHRYCLILIPVLIRFSPIKKRLSDQLWYTLLFKFQMLPPGYILQT